MNEQCVSPRSFDCECKIGFTRNKTGSCVDIDECSTLNNCHVKARCRNTKGSYQCNCDQGYYGNGKVCLKGQCVDSNCPENQMCSSPSTLDCECRAGYIAGNDSNSCVDFDECAQNEFDCKENTECKNSVGSYYCTCKTGFFENRGKCSKPLDVLVTHLGATVVIDSNGNLNSLEENTTATGFVSSGCFEKDELSKSPNFCAVTWKTEMYLYGNGRIARVHGYKLSILDKKLNFNYHRGACSAMNDEFIFLCFNAMEKTCRRATDPVGDFTKVLVSNKYHQEIPISASESKLPRNEILYVFSDQLLAVGGNSRDGQPKSKGHSEGHYFDNNQNKWVDIDHYPFAVLESTFLFIEYKK